MTAPSRIGKQAPPPIIHTRIPIELQQVFLASNRGEEVDIPPPTNAFFSRKWAPSRKDKAKSKKAVRCSDKREANLSLQPKQGSNRYLFFGKSMTAHFKESEPASRIYKDDDALSSVVVGRKPPLNRWKSFPANPSKMKNNAPSRWGSPPKERLVSSAAMPKLPSRNRGP